MFDVASSEFLVVALIALVVIGPKELPAVMRKVGGFVAKARRVTGKIRSGFDEMVREAELDELKKEWQAQNENIMREHPMSDYENDADAKDGTKKTVKSDDNKPKNEELPL
ncbi:twin arginine-targeting protein translocase TatB [Sphingorhabdus lutea]|uniref:Twin arginine-targeting protein translocase TatB n=1 Tax=Sphingorhabdus lutea TaxID=1913578 RepID=A0A1L3JCX4_9SPHN|nr:Sec-independent protein translocase protein TatB [Sphingorhabdus lutea]APG62985.1 twin arginine-targeting protein translocase TatB [Sphingorhabdus lutea]